ncbi:p21-activated kinase 3 [Trypanosoma rangeli SC58]|uniref:p21-activated kinase 3 n=1 Tax=Trypanosoma rangeli SC58 TaxID=429131 RepID=A0A061IZJ7_TRYRA|nr:p21-activated kinase 3 [Trypanosoma rangeli SC58]
MTLLNRPDRALCQELVRSNFTLSQVRAYNEPEFSGWMSRRLRVTNVFVWEFNWFLTSGNYLLRFAQKKASCHPTEIIYLPEAVVRRCCVTEECSVGHPFVLEIVPGLHFVRREEALVPVNPHEVHLSFENVEELCGAIAFFEKISARHVRTAAITFGPPARVGHRIHTRATREGNDVVPHLRPSAARKWLPHQGTTPAALRGNKAAAIDCANTLHQFELQRRVLTNVPHTAGGIISQGRRGNRGGPPAPMSRLEPQGVTLRSLLSDGDPEVLFSDWERLDGGSQGEVFKAVRILDGDTVAIKRITVGRDKKVLPFLVKEISLLKALQHPNIVTLYDCYRKDKHLFLVMEFMDGGKLTDLLFPSQGERVEFTETQLATLMREVLQALQCLHNFCCVHRDVKSDNILLSSRGEVKLGDFGFATLLTPAREMRRTVVGTPYWMAPEVAGGRAYNSKADVWSAGILFLEMCDGEPPLMGLNPMRALLKISADPPPVMKTANRWSSLCREFASFLLIKDPARRPSVDAALRHPFIVKKAKPKCEFLVPMLEQQKT